LPGTGSKFVEGSGARGDGRSAIFGAAGGVTGRSVSTNSRTLARALRQRKLRYGVASACIGGGQGIAILVENPDFFD
jgi:acetyl-CoA C-acetyltransferase